MNYFVKKGLEVVAFAACVSLLAFSAGLGLPREGVAQSLSTAPLASYVIVSASPTNFPILPVIPWPPVRALYQDNAVFQMINTAVPPNVVRFSDQNGNVIDVPISRITTLANGDKSLGTPVMLVPHILPGPVDIQILNTINGVSSNVVQGTYP